MTLRLRARLDAEAGGFVRPTRQAREELGRFKSAAGGAGRAARGAARDTGRYAQAADRAGRETRGFGRSLGALRGLIAGAGVGLLARQLVQTGLAADRVAVRFRTAAGGVEAGAAAMEQARETAERFGLELTGVERGFSGLLAAARGTSLEDDAVSIFEGVATAASALQLSGAETQGVLTAIEQVMSKGTVQAEELRGQIGERLPGAFQIAARSMNVTTGELSKMLEQGEVLAEDFLPRLARQLLREFGGAAAEAAGEATAEFNRFRNEFIEVQRAVSEGGFLEGLTRGLTTITERLRDPATQAGMRQFGSVLGEGLSFAAENAEDLTAAIGGLIGLKLAATMIGWGRAAAATAQSLGVLRFALGALGGPVGLLGAAVATLPFLIDSTGERVDEMERTLGAADDAMQAFAEASRQAAREQQELGGKVSDATRELRAQSRLELQQSLEAAQQVREDAVNDIRGIGALDLSEIAPVRNALVEEAAKIEQAFGDIDRARRIFLEGRNTPGILGSVFDDLVKLLNRAERGDTSAVSELADELERIGAVGAPAKQAAEDVVLALDGLGDVDLGVAQARVLRLARGIGGLGDQIAAVTEAADDTARARALGVLANEMIRMARAGAQLREDGPQGLLDLLRVAGQSEEKIARVRALLEGTADITDEVGDAAGDVDFDPAARGAGAMADEIARAGRALASLQKGVNTLSLGNAGLEAQLAALRGGAPQAEARAAAKLAESRAGVAPLLTATAQGPARGNRPGAQESAALRALRGQREALRDRVGLEREINAILASRREGGGVTGATAGAGRELSALAEAAEEFRARFGASFEAARRDILAWRDRALAQLEDVGAGHEDLAAQVEAVTRARLSEAYRRDLANREDWRAGVERGLSRIGDAHASMADIAEDTVVTAFRSMEDAFVSLATTGKIETQDLVDFALRQVFRLASGFATGDIGGGGGGGGGGLLGRLLSSLVGGAQADQLHEGGIAGRDGRARTVPAAALAGAPRLHLGGLLPGERPAILEADERVLTTAQQEATAATIRGLSDLAARPERGGANRPTEVNINVIGGREPDEVRTRGSNGRLDVDLVYQQFEDRLSRETARGEGVAPAVAGRFGLRTERG